MALFVVGPNHIDVPPGGNVDAEGVENLAKRIRASWGGDPRKIVVAISETGGCSNCGLPSGLLPAGSAHTLAGKLQDLYGSAFQVRRAIPALPTDYAAMPAIVTGGFWAPPNGIDFIGKDYASRGRLINPGADYRYGRVVLTSSLGAVGFSIVHLDVQGRGANRRTQVFDLMNEIASSDSQTSANLIVGDFNHTLVSGGPQDGDDLAWTGLLHNSSVWMTGGAQCAAAGRQSTLYDDVMNIAEITGSRRSWRLRPFRYYFDAAADGTPLDPSGTMHVLGVQHSMIGVLFKVDSAIMR